MNRVLHIARREWREHHRQPRMILAMAAVLAMISLTVMFGVGIMALISIDPAQVDLLKSNLAFAGYELQDPVDWAVQRILASFDFLLFTQFLGMTSVLAGHAFIHERQHSTLPFVLLAPVRRGELVLGKLLGIVGTPFLVMLLVGGSAALLLSRMDITAAYAWRLPPSPGWMVAFFLGGPAWAVALAGMGAAVSLRSRDVRTAQQGVWLVVFFATLVVGMALGGALQEDVGFQLVVALLGLLAAAGTVLLGTMLLARDIHL